MEQIVAPPSREEEIVRKTGPYVRLMEQFSSRSLPVHAFERTYLDTFAADPTRWPAPVYRILNDVFLDIDAFDPDPEDRAEEDIDEAELRSRVERSLAALRGVL